MANEITNQHVDDVLISFDKTELDYNIFFCNELVLEHCFHALKTTLFQQFAHTDGVAMPRVKRCTNQADCRPGEILAQMVDKHKEVLLDFLPSIPHVEGSDCSSKPPYHNLIIFGSLMVVPFLDYLCQIKESQWITLTIVEDDYLQLVAALSLVRLDDIVDACKQKGIKLTLHIDRNPAALKDRLYTQISRDNPTLLYGWQTLRSPVRSPGLSELHSWLHAPEGAAHHAIGILGYATDEFNQTQQALWNSLASKKMHVISPGQLDAAVPVVLVASGPSLIEHLDWLKKYSERLNIVAAGSALGVLVRSGIRPSCAVFLERGGEVYADLCDLLADGYTIKGITALVSSTIDPRVPDLFSSAAFFHRPVAAATGLFPDDHMSTLPICGPHVINAALEATLLLGSRQLLLVGTDFAALKRDKPRAEGALGISPRELSIPVSGNHGRTVFSEPGLLHTRYLFDRMIDSTPGCKVKRLGEGAILQSAESVDSSEELAEAFGCAPYALTQALTKLPCSSFSCQDCITLFDLLSYEAGIWGEDIARCVQSEEEWTRGMADKIAPFLQRMHEGDSRQRRFLVQLLCQPLFFAAMALHDAPQGDHNAFVDARNKFLVSVNLMQAVVNQWLEVMRPWINAPQLPLWNPEWLRSRYRKMEA